MALFKKKTAEESTTSPKAATESAPPEKRAKKKVNKEVATLIRALPNKEWPERLQISGQLADIGTEAVGPLCEMLEDKRWLVRWNAAVILGWIGDNEALEPLLKRLNETEQPPVQEAVLQALGNLKVGEAVEKIIPYLKESDPALQIAAAEALGNIGSPEAIPHLLEATHAENLMVRLAAALALGRLGYAASLTVKFPEMEMIIQPPKKEEEKPTLAENNTVETAVNSTTTTP